MTKRPGHEGDWVRKFTRQHFQRRDEDSPCQLPADMYEWQSGSW